MSKILLLGEIDETARRRRPADPASADRRLPFRAAGSGRRTAIDTTAGSHAVRAGESDTALVMRAAISAGLLETRPRLPSWSPFAGSARVSVARRGPEQFRQRAGRSLFRSVARSPRPIAGGHRAGRRLRPITHRRPGRPGGERRPGRPSAHYWRVGGTLGGRSPLAGCSGRPGQARDARRAVHRRLAALPGSSGTRSPSLMPRPSCPDSGHSQAPSRCLGQPNSRNLERQEPRRRRSRAEIPWSMAIATRHQSWPPPSPKASSSSPCQNTTASARRSSNPIERAVQQELKRRTSRSASSPTMQRCCVSSPSPSSKSTKRGWLRPDPSHEKGPPGNPAWFETSRLGAPVTAEKQRRPDEEHRERHAACR